MKSTMRIPILLVSTMISLTSHAATDFFANVDAKIKDASSLSNSRLASERYYKLMARLSVYALYCDAKNELGYSGLFHQVYVSTEDLQKEAEIAFGGFQAAYNKLEKYRNQESLRYLEAGPSTCQASFDSFKSLVMSSPSSIRKKINETPVGRL